jgi:hypothetical protein
MRKTLLLCCLFIYSNIVWAQGLVAYYPFNGNAYDESGNGHNGIVNGASLIEDRFNQQNQAFYFAGNNSNIAIPHDPDFNFYPFSNSISISVWVRPDNILFG